MTDKVRERVKGKEKDGCWDDGMRWMLAEEKIRKKGRAVPKTYVDDGTVWWMLE